jgi:hypothetical protein
VPEAISCSEQQLPELANHLQCSPLTVGNQRARPGIQ